MRKLTVFNLFIVVGLILGSCATSNDVVSNRMISKRKYNKGFFIKKSGNNNSKGEVKEIELARSESEVATNSSFKHKAQTTENTSITNEMNEVASVDNADYQYDDFVVASANDDMEMVLASSSSNRNESVVAEEKSTKVTSITKEQKKEFKKALKNERKNQKSNSYDDAMFILIVIITILIPPLGVLLYTNIDWTKVLISLLLTFLFYVPGLIYSLLVVFDVI